MKRGGDINEAITRGLAPTAPLRDSAIPWLGHVPAHWEILRLKWAVMLQRGHDLPADERVDGNVPIVSSSGISGFHNAPVAKAPGIVTGRYGTIGVFHLIEEDYWPLNTTLYSNDLNGRVPDEAARTGEASGPDAELSTQALSRNFTSCVLDGSGTAFQPNIRLSRIETRWAGKINERIGAGIEIQFQESVEGSPEKLVNDAFLEYYLTDRATVRAGQFIKPFGFSVQPSSWLRESPERPMFSGYFFPGERDRGIMLSGDLGFLPAAAFKDLQYFLGAFNSNRFFNDSNRQVNYMARIRKIFDKKKLAVGASVQLGKQLLPPGASGNGNERLFGLDFQFTTGRFGLRGEAMAGNRPSTLATIEPQFFPAFRPGAHSSAAELLVNYRVAGAHNVYARYNQFNGDPVTGLNIRAFNFGYFLPIGQRSRLSFDYQFKNHPSFEDDAVNGRFQITWGILLK